jgi:hypothetical protein
MSESQELNQTPIKKGRGRPKKEKVIIIKEKNKGGRPKKYANGARAHRDENRQTLISKQRLEELLEIEKKYNQLNII